MKAEDATNLLSDYWDEAELAAALGLSVVTIRRWRAQKKGPPVTYRGRTPFYYKPSAKTWFAAQEQPAERHHQNRRLLPA